MNPWSIAFLALSAVCLIAATAPWWEDAIACWWERRAIRKRRQARAPYGWTSTDL